MGKIEAKNIFVEKANKKFNNFFDYSKVNYTKSTIKVEIGCPIHGSFLQSPSCHLDSIHACQLCGKESNKVKSKYKTDRFKEKASKKHNNFYNYDKSTYTKSSDKLVIICPIHGDFEQRAGAHMKGNGCIKCRDDKHKKEHTKTTDAFVKEATKVHDNFYKYNETIYINHNKKLLITCPTHGGFNQTPSSHLSGSGCPECGKLKTGSKKDTNEEFIEKAIKVHGNKYNYTHTTYTESKNKVVVLCPTHGEFTQKASSHLSGNGCKKCTFESNRCKTQEQYIEEVKKIHNEKYTYGNTIYKGSLQKIIVTCSLHGDFKQGASSHSQGAGCPKCGRVDSGGFSKTTFIKKSNGRLCTFYTLRCFNSSESFYKIGITMLSVKDRYSTPARMPYLYEVVSEIYGEAGSIWNLEKEEKRILKSLNYQPTLEFAGSKTECFTNYKIENEK